MELKFNPGQIVATAGVDNRLNNDEKFREFAFHSLERHLNCDWGDMDEEDKQQNDYAVMHDERLLSCYIFEPGTDDKIWIITEWDRSVTTILFPSDY